MTYLTMLPSSLGELIMKIVHHPPADEEEKQQCEDGHRKMVDEETVYVAVPLQTV